MTDDELRDAVAALRMRVPQTPQDAAALRADVRALDAALGARLRDAAAAGGPDRPQEETTR